MAPPKLRGRFNQLYQLVLTFFILVAQVINLIINVTQAVRYMLSSSFWQLKPSTSSSMFSGLLGMCCIPTCCKHWYRPTVATQMLSMHVQSLGPMCAWAPISRLHCRQADENHFVQSCQAFRHSRDWCCISADVARNLYCSGRQPREQA